MVSIPIGLKAEDRGTISVLFCDVYDFQNIVGKVAPTHLVKVLDSLFLCFDKCAEKFGCTKIETVFETYLAAAGINLDSGQTSSEQSSPCENALDALCMALVMLRFSRHVTYVLTEKGSGEGRSIGETAVSDALSFLSTEDRGSNNHHRRVRRIRVKIGIHSGRVISGVVGAKKPQYALFGDTVNTASRMKTTGQPDHVHVSSATHELVKGDPCLIWEQRKIQVKGKGTMTTYLLLRVDLPTTTRHSNLMSARSMVLPDLLRSSNEIISTSKQQQSSSFRAAEQFRASFRDDCLADLTPGQLVEEDHPLWIRFQRKEHRNDLLSLSRSGADQSLHAKPPMVILETAYEALVRRFENKSDPNNASKMESSSGVWKSGSSYRISTEIQGFSLAFRDKALEQRYKNLCYSKDSNIKSIEQALIIFIVAYLIQTLVLAGIPRNENNIWNFKAQITWNVRSTFITIFVAFWLLLHFRDRTLIASRISIEALIYATNVLFMATAFAVMLESAWSQDANKVIWLHVNTLQVFFFVSIIHHNAGLLVQHLLVVNIVFTIVSILFIVKITIMTRISQEALYIIPLFIVANVLSVFLKEYVDRQSFIVNEDMQQMEDRGKELLSDMLPKEVLEELEQENLKLAYKHERITFIFADICGFTTWAETVDSSEVVTVLQSLFAKFDRDSTKFGVFKVCTIGDAYVAISEPASEQTIAQGNYDPAIGAERVLTMAQCMIRDIKLVREKLNVSSFTQFQFRPDPGTQYANWTTLWVLCWWSYRVW